MTSIQISVIKKGVLKRNCIISPISSCDIVMCHILAFHLFVLAFVVF